MKAFSDAARGNNIQQKATKKTAMPIMNWPQKVRQNFKTEFMQND
jgi:hypothetical protein